MSDCSTVLLEQLAHLTSFKSLHIRVGRIVNHDKCLPTIIATIIR